jgi:hypothetical protein
MGCIGSQRTSCAFRGSRRTSWITSSPRFFIPDIRAAPIRPEAPLIRMRGIGHILLSAHLGTSLCDEPFGSCGARSLPLPPGAYAPALFLRRSAAVKCEFVPPRSEESSCYTVRVECLTAAAIAFRPRSAVYFSSVGAKIRRFAAVNGVGLRSSCWFTPMDRRGEAVPPCRAPRYNQTQGSPPDPFWVARRHSRAGA